MHTHLRPTPIPTPTPWTLVQVLIIRSNYAVRSIPWSERPGASSEKTEMLRIGQKALWITAGEA